MNRRLVHRPSLLRPCGVSCNTYIITKLDVARLIVFKGRWVMYD